MKIELRIAAQVPRENQNGILDIQINLLLLLSFFFFFAEILKIILN